MVNLLEVNKIPEIIYNVAKNLSNESVDLFKIDMYIHILINLTEKECYFLKNNRSSDFYENDFQLLVQTLEVALKLYEDNEFYEFCQQIFTSLEKYRKM